MANENFPANPQYGAIETRDEIAYTFEKGRGKKDVWAITPKSHGCCSVGTWKCSRYTTDKPHPRDHQPA